MLALSTHGKEGPQMSQIQVLMKEILLAAEKISAAAKAQYIPYHPPILTGQMWVLELINGHPDRIRSELDVRKHVFKQLVDELSSHGYHHSKHITLEEQLSIFLYTCVTGLPRRHVGERFRRSNDMISIYFRKMLEAFSSPGIYTKYVELPRSDDPTPSRIADDPAVYPFFKDAVGVIEGIHIACTPSAAERWATRNRRGFLSQNCLVCCNFDLEFMYVVSGWEGSADDASIYHDARTEDFTVPIGKYCLADAGYPRCPQLLVPYRGTRSPLPEWDRLQMRPQNAHEYFNLRHTQLRNVVERIIGVLKRRFRILVIPPPEYDMDIQARIPAALSCIHNIIRRYDPEELREPEVEQAAVEAATAGADQLFGNVAGGFITIDEYDAMAAKRDEIAESLWQNHLNYISHNQHVSS